MPKFAINELFYELGTAEQKTLKGGEDMKLLKGIKPKIQKMPSKPVSLRREMDPGWLEHLNSNRADRYGW
jgi:hypothetical protein